MTVKTIILKLYLLFPHKKITGFIHHPSAREDSMSRTTSCTETGISNERADLRNLQAIVGIEGLTGDAWYAEIPFSNEDTTHGSENEYQTAICGSQNDADLPISIRQSKYYSNIVRRIRSGDIAKRNAYRINDFLDGNDERVWENSWVRFPAARIKERTMKMIMHDMKYNKADECSPLRPDIDRFFFEKNGEQWLRLPASYILKISIADALDDNNNATEAISSRILNHFLNDNSSPETFSFAPVRATAGKSAGKALSEETLLRYLLSQFAVMYANRAFSLESYGQKLVLYFAPSTPLRMRKLNSLISDSFYRDIFMNPCLSGWDRGYEKHEYMHLCHQVLSRSHLNSIFKLKESGIISKPLVQIDSISNTSLANNGTHISTGSIKLSRLASEGTYNDALEKSAGDLVIKMFEHFLPLFTPLYSSSPLRIGYNDFRPENLIGFLSHELDYTHLRMIWSKWVRKAGIEFFGRPLLPYGPSWYEKIWSTLFRFKGDAVPDARITDYLIALMSTPESQALNGKLGNDTLLRSDLSDLGIFDRKMSMYLPYKLREFRKIGFTGFEGRFYSQFESLGEDMSDAADLQQLITAFCYAKILKSSVIHEDIPDDPMTESERRQIFFSAAIGLDTASVRENNHGNFMTSIISLTESIRPSRRHQGFLRFRIDDYRLALVKLLETDKALIESLGVRELIERLRSRIGGRTDTHSKLVSGIIGPSKKPMYFTASEFNEKTERFYRTVLREKNISEAIDVLSDSTGAQERINNSDYAALTKELGISIPMRQFVERNREGILKDTISLSECRTLLTVTALTATYAAGKEKSNAEKKELIINDSSVYRQDKFAGGDRENISRQSG